MHDARGVRFVEGRHDLNRVPQRLIDRQPRAGQSRGERLPFEVLHDDEVQVAVTADVMNRADMRMRNRGNRPRLALEARAKLRVARDVPGQDFDRHRPVKARVTRFVHVAHAAGAFE